VQNVYRNNAFWFVYRNVFLENCIDLCGPHHNVTYQQVENNLSTERRLIVSKSVQSLWDNKFDAYSALINKSEFKFSITWRIEFNEQYNIEAFWKEYKPKSYFSSETSGTRYRHEMNIILKNVRNIISLTEYFDLDET